MRIAFLLAMTVVLDSCQYSSSQPNAKTTAVQDTVLAAPVFSPNNYQQTALFLAGMAQSDTSAIVLPKLIKNQTYQRFCDTMNVGFHNMETTRLSKMRDWAKTELSYELANPKTVLYPFSGPDILHCVQFYPDADQYVMIALEKYGSLPQLNKMDSAKSVHYLNSISQSLEDIFGKSYFITRKMLKDVSNSVNGVVPLVSIFLVRTGHEIKDIQYKHLNNDGSLKPIAADSCGKYLNDLVEIYFTKTDSSHIQKITYFRANLCDEGYGGMMSLTNNKTLQNYLNALPECYTYVKAASYVMNYKTFSIIRNICLSKSKSVLQDDTGIAYRYIDKNKWNIKLYGSYVKPVSDFDGVWQDDLNLAYKKDSASVKKLAFSLGYHWGNLNAQNLMKFEKR
ncbi:MAG TPA: hypothetical protein VGB95_02665 [Chitinophagales bacterium]